MQEHAFEVDDIVPPPLRRLWRTVGSRRVGMLKDFALRPPPPGGDGLWHGVVRFGGSRIEGHPHLNHAGSAGWTAAEAALGAIAEGVERYAWTQPAPASSTIGRPTPAQLERSAIPFDRLPRDAAASPDDVQEVRQVESPWMRGRSLVSGADRIAPAYMVLPAHRPSPLARRVLVTDMTTTGAAAGGDLDRAALAGMSEVVERDAYAITHLGRLRLPEFDLALVDDPRLHGLLARVRTQRGWRVRAWDMRLHVDVPTVLAACQFLVDGEPAIRIAAAVRMHEAAALEKAIVEVVQAMDGVSEQSVRETRASGNGFRVASLDDHIRLGDLPEYVATLDWLLASRPRRAPEGSGSPVITVPEAHDRLMAALVSQGLEPVSFRITPAEIRDEGLLEVVRILIPGTFPLLIGPPRAVVSPRLAAATEGEPNPVPHCFP